MNITYNSNAFGPIALILSALCVAKPKAALGFLFNKRYSQREPGLFAVMLFEIIAGATLLSAIYITLSAMMGKPVM